MDKLKSAQLDFMGAATALNVQTARLRLMIENYNSTLRDAREKCEALNDLVSDRFTVDGCIEDAHMHEYSERLTKAFLSMERAEITPPEFLDIAPKPTSLEKGLTSPYHPGDPNAPKY